MRKYYRCTRHLKIKKNKRDAKNQYLHLRIKYIFKTQYGFRHRIYSFLFQKLNSPVDSPECTFMTISLSKTISLDCFLLACLPIILCKISLKTAFKPFLKISCQS